MADASDDAPDIVDARIGALVDERYTILEAMASGAMGAVYRAERVPVGKIVAIKFLHASFAKDSEFLIRFERETRAMSKLAHPNCVSVVDFGVWQESPYLVMEYVAGTTLRQLLDSERLAPARALGFARQIAAGLAHAHAQGIVHRDIKPANIMVSDEIGAGEHVRLLDFGLARLRGAGGARDATLANVVVGTPNYMAPEQTVPGGTIDARTDIYAAGVLLFEMLAGGRPFAADDTLSLFGMHRAAPIPRLADRMPEGVEVPEGAQKVIDTAMAKSPKDRYQTAVELAAAIEGVIEGGRVEAALRAAGSSSTRVQVAGATSPGSGPTAAAIPVTAIAVAEAKRKSAVSAAVEPTRVADSPPVVAARAVPREQRAMSAPIASLAPERKNMRPGLIALGMIVVVGAATAWVIHRSGQARAHEAAATFDAAAIALAGAPVVTPDAEVVAPDAEVAIDASVAILASDAAVVEADAAGSAAATVAGTGIGSGSEIEMDPATAEDLDPRAAQGSAAVDEAADAPATTDDVEKRAPAPPTQADNIHDALQMIQDGKRDLALASLRALWKKQPSSAYIPFLLGNLYFDERWWAVSMEHYRQAIAKDPQYKNNPTLNRNIIRMLASTKTQGGATLFLRHTIGHPALPYLKAAAAHEDNTTVRHQAAAIAKLIK